ncbi:MAG: hypothetical protein ABMB14_20660 [Myxococcota bacterium]
MATFPPFPLAAGPATLVVSAVSGPYFTVGDAVSDADPGDVIEIHDGGTFDEAVAVSEDLTIRSVGAIPTLHGTHDTRGFFRVTNGARLELFDLAFHGQTTQPAIRVERAEVEVNDCTFVATHSPANGGAISADAAVENAVLLFDSTFSASTSDADGGFVAIEGGVLVVEGCTFDGGDATGRGGAVYTAGTTTAIGASRFDGNDSGLEGGAVFHNGPFLSVDGTWFVGNEAGGDGGAIRHDAGDGSYASSVFCGNSAAGDGGAIQVAATGGLTVGYSVFVDNEATVDGGAISAGAAITVTHATIAANRGVDGQAIDGFFAPSALSDSIVAYHAGTALSHDLVEDFDLFWLNGVDRAMGIAPGPSSFVQDPLIVAPVVGGCDVAGLVPGAGSPAHGAASDGTDLGALQDEDGDGHSPLFDDCDDANPDVHVGAVEVPADGIDQDCDGVEWCYVDTDGDGAGEAPGAPGADLDCDDDGELTTATDICPDGDDRVDQDLDGTPDDCDTCPLDPPDDNDDDDCACDSADVCPNADDCLDTDLDGVPNGCDDCDGDLTDTDQDGVPDACDECEGSPDSEDQDADGIPDGCDTCPDDAAGDSDSDGVCDGFDQCPGSDDRQDADGDGIPDGCDCDGSSTDGDTDGDGLCDGSDPCPTDPDPTCTADPRDGQPLPEAAATGCQCDVGGSWVGGGWVLGLVAYRRRSASRRSASHRSGRAHAAR